MPQTTRLAPVGADADERRHQRTGTSGTCTERSSHSANGIHHVDGSSTDEPRLDVGRDLGGERRDEHLARAAVDGLERPEQLAVRERVEPDLLDGLANGRRQRRLVGVIEAAAGQAHLPRPRIVGALLPPADHDLGPPPPVAQAEHHRRADARPASPAVARRSPPRAPRWSGNSATSVRYRAAPT